MSGPNHQTRGQLLDSIDAKIAELKAAIREANTVLKDTRAEHKELKAHLTWAMDEHHKLLTDMVEKSSAEVLRATHDVMATVARQLADIVQRAQSVQTLTRVDRLLRYVETQLGDGGGENTGEGGPCPAEPSCPTH